MENVLMPPNDALAIANRRATYTVKMQRATVRAGTRDSRQHHSHALSGSTAETWV